MRRPSSSPTTRPNTSFGREPGNDSFRHSADRNSIAGHLSDERTCDAAQLAKRLGDAAARSHKLLVRGHAQGLAFQAQKHHREVLYHRNATGQSDIPNNQRRECDLSESTRQIVVERYLCAAQYWRRGYHPLPRVVSSPAAPRRRARRLAIIGAEHEAERHTT